MTSSTGAEICGRCGHDALEHGFGCTHGWGIGEGICHCPNDDSGRVSTGCQHIDCNTTPTHVHPMGYFLCAEHAERAAKPIDEIVDWTEHDR